LNGSKVGRRMFSRVTKTWNPVIGCHHSCVYCWARKIAKRQRKRCELCYRFEPHLHPERIANPPRRGYVFACDMADLFGEWVPDEWITQVVEAIDHVSTATFLLLTKNPSRLVQYVRKHDFPRHIDVGVTLETNRGSSWYEQISKAPTPPMRVGSARHLVEMGFRPVVSIEPILDFDPLSLTSYIIALEPKLIYIGYDNYKNKLPEPSIDKTKTLIEWLRDLGFKVEVKSLRKAWWEK